MKDTIKLILIGIIFLLGHFLINFVGAEDNMIIYNKNWTIRERIGPNGTMYDQNWNTIGYVRGGKLYDKNWNLQGQIKKHDIGKKSSGKK